MISALCRDSKRLRAHRRGVAVEGHHVVALAWPILKHEDLAPSLRAKIEQLVACAAQEAGEIEVTSLERALCPIDLCMIVCPIDT
jgi:hypothetical protein